jgi:hypothetical protein
MEQTETCGKEWEDADFFFATLSPMQGAYKLLDYLFSLEDKKIIICSSVSAEENTRIYERRVLEKKWAMNKHFHDYPFAYMIFTESSGAAKAEYANSMSLLIDDWDRNTIVFEEEGGTAILHEKAEDTIAQLEELRKEGKL